MLFKIHWETFANTKICSCPTQTDFSVYETNKYLLVFFKIVNGYISVSKNEFHTLEF